MVPKRVSAGDMDDICHLYLQYQRELVDDISNDRRAFFLASIKTILARPQSTDFDDRRATSRAKELNEAVTHLKNFAFAQHMRLTGGSLVMHSTLS